MNIISSVIKALLQPFISYKYLLFQLTQKEIKARYKQSFIGYAWVMLNPLSQLVVYSFVFSLVFRFADKQIPYVIFLFAGLLPWTLLQSSISSATQSLVNNIALIRKVNFPREIIPYSMIAAKFVDFLFSALVFLLFTFIYRVSLSVLVIFFPILLLVQLLLTAGLSLFLAAANLFYRDVQYLTNLLLMLWMYMTPIVYPLSMVPEKYLFWYKLNPMVGLIEGYRSLLFGQELDINLLVFSACSSIVIFLFSFFFFKKSEKIFADIA